MYLTIQGLVLRSVVYNDTDALLTVLTRSHGKITVKARGLRRKNSPLAAPSQLLCFTEFTLFQYKDAYTVNEAHCIELFDGLRRDIQKLSLGTYLAHVAEVVSQEDMPNPELLSLVLNSLYALSKLDINETLVKAAFEMRIACIAGYTPDLSGCVNCGEPFPEMFDISQGHLECSSCRDSSGGIRLPVTAGILEAMRYICNCDIRKLFAFRVGEDTLLALSQLSESYLSTQLERSFSTLDFYKSLFI